jgi:hypothetical protein
MADESAYTFPDASKSYTALDSPVYPDELAFSNSNKQIFRITKEGKLEFGEGVTSDEIAKGIIEAFKDNIDAIYGTNHRFKISPVTQEWTNRLSYMQQSVLLSGIRGCDGLPKRHKSKPLIKWYRRCILLSAFEGKVIENAFDPGGGSFTGPIAELPEELTDAYFENYIKTDIEPRYYAIDPTPEIPKANINDVISSLRYNHHNKVHDWKCAQLQRVADDFIDSRDELHYHYQLHMMHGFEIIGYKHPNEGIRDFWSDMYTRMVHAMHVWPETEAQMDLRLGDNENNWKDRNDRSTSCSD